MQQAKDDELFSKGEIIIVGATDGHTKIFGTDNQFVGLNILRVGVEDGVELILTGQDAGEDTVSSCAEVDCLVEQDIVPIIDDGSIHEWEASSPIDLFEGDVEDFIFDDQHELVFDDDLDVGGLLAT